MDDKNLKKPKTEGPVIALTDATAVVSVRRFPSSSLESTQRLSRRSSVPPIVPNSHNPPQAILDDSETLITGSARELVSSAPRETAPPPMWNMPESLPGMEEAKVVESETKGPDEAPKEDMDALASEFEFHAARIQELTHRLASVVTKGLAGK